MNIEDSNLYQRFLAEREEIMKHKWIESEKQGYDIGFEKALVEWMLHHRKEWLKQFDQNKNQKKFVKSLLSQ